MVQFADRLEGLAAKARAARLSLAPHAERLKKFGLAVALLLFTGGLILAIRSVPDVFDKMALEPFLLLLATVPLLVALNMAEFQLMVRYAGKSVRWRSALEVTVYTSAANMLPIPGGALTRLAALHTYGAPLQTGSLLILLFAGIWGGMAFIYSGAWLLQFQHLGIAVGFLAVGGAILAPSILALRRVKATPSLLVGTLAVRLTTLVLDAMRILLAIHTLGVVVGFEQASILGVSGFLATATLILPGGLGLHEALAALLAPLAGIDSAIGFLSTTVSRINFIVGLLLMSVLLIGVSSVSMWPQGERWRRISERWRVRFAKSSR